MPVAPPVASELFSTDVYTLFSYLGTGLFTAALVPQFIRTLQLGRADDISVLFLLTVIGASIASGVWALSLPNYVVTTGFVANVVVWGYVLKVRLRPRSDAVPLKSG